MTENLSKVGISKFDSRPIGVVYLSSGVGHGHRPPQALGAVDDDDAAVGGLLQLLQQVGAVVRGVATAVRLQDYALHGRLQESPHLHTINNAQFPTTNAHVF